jgi:arylsulfatase A-like enzyme
MGSKMKQNIKYTISAALLVWAIVFPGCGSRTGKGIKPHILLVTIDTLRRDHLGCYGYPRQTSPFIDRLAREGVMFKHVFAPLPLTAPSHASILTSLHPLVHGSVDNRGSLDQRVQTIAETLKQDGYHTIGAVGVKILSGEKNFSQGFEQFGDHWDKGENGTWKHQRIASMVNDDLCEKIDRYQSQYANRPLFIWLHYYDPHTPYADRKEIRFKKPLPYPPGDERREDEKIDCYDKEIRYVDDCLREVYRHLEARKLTTNLVTCVTADHGEEFGEHGVMYYHSDFYSETSMVPLIFHGPGIRRGAKKNAYVSTMDIGVTLLARAGLVFDTASHGIDLSPYLTGAAGQPPPKRKFLVVGMPRYTRSLQLVAEPFAYIMNFDHHYRYWYLGFNGNLPENRLKPVQPGWIERKAGTVEVNLPYSGAMGRNFAVLSADVVKNNGMNVRVLVKPGADAGGLDVSPDARPRQMDVLYPVTVLDDVSIRLEMKEGTELANFRYGFISKNQFPQGYRFLRKRQNNIFKHIKSRRKQESHDECFNLANDIGMRHNLVFDKKKFSFFIKSRKFIYQVFRNYTGIKNKLLNGGPRGRPATEQEKEMLESLGYL